MKSAGWTLSRCSRRLIRPLVFLTDSNAPTWANNLDGQVNLRDAVRRQISFKGPNGKEYKLNDKIATLLVRCAPFPFLFFWYGKNIYVAALYTVLVDGTLTRPTSLSTASPCPARSSTSDCTSSTTLLSSSLADTARTTSEFDTHSPAFSGIKSYSQKPPQNGALARGPPLEYVCRDPVIPSHS